MKTSEYFKLKTDKSIVFVGDKLTVKISKRFENYKLLMIKETVKTIGIFQMQIGDKKSGFLLPAVVEMCPSYTSIVTENGETYVECTFEHGDIFIKDKRVVKNAHLAYVVFTEFVEKGKMPDFLSYQDYAFILDIAQNICGIKIPAEHTVFEIIYAFLSRKHDDYTKMYRHTAMDKPPMFLRLSDTPHASTSVTAKLIGNYLADSVNAAIVNESDGESKIEDLLRQ